METEIQFTGNKKGVNLNRLLNLIEEGDAEEVLSIEDHRGGFNELLRYELVAIKDDRIYLTDLGRQAKTIGVERVIENLKTKQKIDPIAVPVQVNTSRKKSIYFYLLLVLALLFIFLYQLALT